MLNISSINPYIRVAMQSVLSKGTMIASRIIFDYELIYIAEGSFILNYNGTDYTCSKGQFVFIRPGISHSFSMTHTDLSQPHIHFDITDQPDSRQVPVCFKDITDLTDDEKSHIRTDIFAPVPKTPFVLFSNTKAALKLFYAIIDQPKCSELSQKGLLIQLLDMLIVDNFSTVYAQNTPSFYGVEAQVKDYFDAGQGMSSNLEDIARQFNYSKYHLERRFKSRYGVSLISYRNQKRLQIAKMLLQTECVSDVANKLGFSSIYVFSRAIKNHFGCSPTQLAKNALEETS